MRCCHGTEGCKDSGDKHACEHSGTDAIAAASFFGDHRKVVPATVPMVLHCPECRTRHVDEGLFATRPHHTHACQGCGLTWRPAIVPTVGVQFLPGFKDDSNRERPELVARARLAAEYAEDLVDQLDVIMRRTRKGEAEIARLTSALNCIYVEAQTLGEQMDANAKTPIVGARYGRGRVSAIVDYAAAALRRGAYAPRKRAPAKKKTDRR